MSSYKVARRSFLAACAASPLLYPLLRNLEAQAQGMPAPLRFLIIHHPLGTQLARWRPTATSTTTTFTLPEASSPFEPLRQNMLLIDGMNIVCGNAGGSGDKTHEGGLLAVMTGVPELGRLGQQDHVSGGPSIEQLFLARSPVLGGSGAPADQRTPYGSLQLGSDIRADRNEVSPRVLSYRPSVAGSDLNSRRQPMYPITQPLTVYNNYFASLMPGMGGGGSGAGGGAGSNAQAAALIAQRRSVLDFMRSDLTRMSTLVPADQKPKLDVYADSIRQLESSLLVGMGGSTGTGGSGSTTPGVCVKPGAPMSYTETGGFDPAHPDLNPPSGTVVRGFDQYIPGNPNSHPHQEVSRLHLAMIKTAFACDLARAATFMYSPGTNQVVFPGTMAGASLGSQSSSHHPPSHTTSTSFLNWLNQVDKWYAQQTAEALLEFKAQMDVDGSNLLENTVVVYVSEVARAHDHDFHNVPWAVFGGANTRLDTGKFLKVTGGPLPQQTDASADGTGTGNRPINDLWMALAPIFGISNLTTLGSNTNGTMYTGPLPGVLKA